MSAQTEPKEIACLDPDCGKLFQHGTYEPFCPACEAKYREIAKRQAWADAVATEREMGATWS